MTPWMRMLLPVGFGVVAAIINFVVLNQLNQQVDFVCVGGKLPLVQGTPFDKSNVTRIKVSGDVAKLNKAWIRFEDVDTIYGRPAGRTLVPGEMVLRQDAQPVKELKPGPGEDSLVISLDSVEAEPKLLLIGEEIGFLVKVPKQPTETSSSKVDLNRVNSYNKSEPEFDIEYLGPFKLLSVGDRLSRNVAESKKDGRGDGRTVTIAITKFKKGQKTVEEKYERLVRASAHRSGSRGESDLLKLVLHHRVIEKTPEPAAGSTSAGESKKEGEEMSEEGATDSNKTPGEDDSSSSAADSDPNK